MIEQAYHIGQQLGLPVWTEDEAGPYQTKPYPGQSWQPEGKPARQPHEYVRQGTAKMFTLFQPATGAVRVKGVTRSTNAVLHPWLKAELRAILEALPASPPPDPAVVRQLWEAWQTGLPTPLPLPEELPPLRLLWVWDNLRGHHSREIVQWLLAQGILPLYTPLSGSWLNMAESIQGILSRRALAGQTPASPEAIITALEDTAAGWNKNPTPFEWGGKRAARRQRARQRKHALGGSGACTRRPVARRATLVQKWQRASQMTH